MWSFTRAYSRSHVQAGVESKPRWQLPVALTIYLTLGLLVARTRGVDLWYIDEEIFFAHGVRIMQNGRIGWRVDNWQPPLSYLIHSSLLLLHPLTPKLTGPVMQHPDLPPGQEWLPGTRNPILRDSSAWQVRQAVEASGGRFDDYVFWARVPMVLIGAAALFMTWQILVLAKADPFAGVCILATAPGFVIQQARIIADPVIAVCVTAIVWRALHVSRNPTIRNGAWLGVACGLGVGSKLSILPLLPAFLLAMLPWRWFFVRSNLAAAETSSTFVCTWLRPFLTAGVCSFLTLWMLYGFQLGSINDRLKTQDPDSRPRLLQRLPFLGTATIPMPSLALVFATNQGVAANNMAIKIDGMPDTTCWRKVGHYGTALRDNAGFFLLAMVVLTATAMLGDPRYRLLLAGLGILILAYFSGLWVNNLQMWPRRALVLINLITIIAGLAWRENASQIEQRLRTPLLFGHLGLSLVWNAAFVAGAVQQTAM